MLVKNLFCLLISVTPLNNKTVPVIGVKHIDSIFNRRFISTSLRIMKIGTHNGYFHADEALAIYMLRLLPEYKNSEIVRTRDLSVLEDCDVVVDVGGVYDPSRHRYGANQLYFDRYDHHQREFNDHFDDDHDVTKLSSAGLVYKHFSKRIFKEVYNVNDEDTIEYLYKSIYDKFIESMDANDNGVSISDGELKYKIYTDLPSRVSRLNPSWKDPESVDIDERFMKAVELTGQDFEHFVNNSLNVILPAKVHLEQALEKRFETHKSGRVIELRKSCPFSEFLYKHEDKNGVEEKDRVLFYLTFDESSNTWRSTCIKEKGTQFTSRLPFPEKLRGLRDDKLVEASGIPGLTFIHATGFTCGGKTRESILKLIDMTLRGD